ncbi:MAG: cytochrome c biogenesis protein [Aggregatilineales bacterium]
MTTVIQPVNQAGGRRAARPTLHGPAIAYAPMRTRLLQLLTIVSALLMLTAFGLSLFYASMDAIQGNVQRVFYMHVGAFSAAATAFTVTVVAGALYLITRNARWDKLALAGVEIGLALSTVTLITGAIWARPTWNTWWTRDPRLDSMLVMWVIYAAYLTLRTTISAPERRARFAAVYGILAFVSVIYTTIVTRERPDTLHPVVIAPQIGSASPEAQGSFTLSQDMVLALSVSSIAWIMAAITLIWYRVRIENLAEKVRELKARALEQD